MKKFLSGTKGVALLLFISITLAALSVFALAAGTEADDFNSAVTALQGESELSERQTALEAAETALVAYLAVSGNAKTDSAISAKYNKLVEIRNDMFVEYVSAASEAHAEGDYPTTRANLDYAGAILETLANDEFTNASKTYKQTYQEIVEDLRAPEELAGKYVEYAEKAKNAKTFSDAKKNYDSAKQIERTLDLDGYPGLEEAEQKLKEVQAYMSRCTIAAASFLNAVDNIYSYGDYFEGIEVAIEAYDALEDVTVTGVSEAKSTLDSIISHHNSGAKTGNEISSGLNSMIYGLILGNGETSSGNPFIDWANKTFG